MNTQKASKGRNTRAPSSPPSTAADLARACIGIVPVPEKPPFPINASPIQARDWSIQISSLFELSSIQSHVLKEVAFRGRKEGVCKATLSTLVHDTRIARSSIQTALGKLCELKIIRREEELHRTRWYYLRDTLPARSEIHPDNIECPKCGKQTVRVESTDAGNHYWCIKNCGYSIVRGMKR